MLKQEIVESIHKIVEEGLNILTSDSTATASYADEQITLSISGSSKSVHLEMQRSDFDSVDTLILKLMKKSKRTYIFLKGNI